jgi:hypothetical protein
MSEKQMGQFIKFGLCTKIIYPEKEKNKIEKYYNGMDEFVADFKKQTNLNPDVFNLREEDDSLIFAIKDELLTPDSLISFLNDLFHDIYDKEHLKIYCDDIYAILRTVC